MGAFGITDDEYSAWLAKDGLRVVLAECDAWDGALVTRYLSNSCFVTRPIDTPANQVYAEVIREIPGFEAQLAEAFTGRSLPSWGELVIHNLNGDYDAWLDNGWDGRAVTLSIGAPDWHRPDFRPFLTGIAADIDAPSRDTLAIKLRDKVHLFDRPIQTNLIGGTTANKDQPVPLCFGECFNVEPVLTDAATHTYQVHDGTIEAITEVRDNGVSVAFTANLAAGTFTLSAAPAGRITADVKGAKPAGIWLRNMHEIVEHLAKNVAGLTTADLDPVSFPAFAVDFINSDDFDPRITFTRASSKTYFDGAGTLRTAATNEPCIDYDPVTLVCKGLSIHEARTNVFLNSLADGTSLSTQSITVTAAPWTISFYGTGTITFSGAYTGSLVGTGDTARAISTFTPSAGTLTCTVSGTVKWANAELGASATPFIATAGATATRAADVASMTGANFSSWYNQAEGTFVCIGDITYTASNFPHQFIVSNGGGSNAIYGLGRGSTTTTRMESFVGGVSQVTINSTIAVASGTSAKTARAYKLNDYALTCNGETVVVDTAATVPTVDRIHFGSYLGSSGFLNGHIARIAYYPSRLPNAVIAGLASGLWAPITTPLGLYVKERRNLIDVIDDLVASVGAFWSFDRAGLLYLGRLEAPAGTAALSLIADDIEAESIGLVDRRLPAASVRLGYAKNWAPQDADALAGAVSEADRALYAAPYSVAATTNDVATAHPLASNPDVVETLIVSAADAATEAARRAELHAVARSRLRLATFSNALSLHLGDVVELTHPRFGFSAGELAVVVGIRERILDNRVELELWK